MFRTTTNSQVVFNETVPGIDFADCSISTIADQKRLTVVRLHKEIGAGPGTSSLRAIAFAAAPPPMMGRVFILCYTFRATYRLLSFMSGQTACNQVPPVRGHYLAVQPTKLKRA